MTFTLSYAEIKISENGYLICLSGCVEVNQQIPHVFLRIYL